MPGRAAIDFHNASYYVYEYQTCQFLESRQAMSANPSGTPQNPSALGVNDRLPELMVTVNQLFGIASDLKVPAFEKGSDLVPEIDDAYRFDPETTFAILAGFAHNRRVMIQGYHGTGSPPTSSKWRLGSTGPAYV